MLPHITPRLLQIALAAPLLCAAASPADTSSDADFQWPRDAETAVILTYDDAVPSQLDFALPALNERDLKGTFFVSVGAGTLDDRAVEWMGAAAAGHELANHTAFHPCRGDQAGRDWVSPDNDLASYSLKRIEAELKLTDAFLHALDGERERTFAYPCGDTTVGPDKASYVPLVNDRYLAARGVGTSSATSIKDLNFAYTGCFDGADKTGEELIAYVESCRESGMPAVLLFHGVGGDHLVTDVEAHEQLLDYLAKHRSSYWVTTYKSAMQHAADEFYRLGWKMKRER